MLRFLASKDEIDQHIAVWTLTQLFESNGCSIFDMIDSIDNQIQKLIRQETEFQGLLKRILRNATTTDEAVDDSDFEDESDVDNPEEANEFINLTRAALVYLKQLPKIEELEASKDSGKGGHEGLSKAIEQTPSMSNEG